MCGIVGAVAQRDVAEILVEGLHRLEYRGYDSAGIAIVNEKHELSRLRALGKVQNLDIELAKNPIKGGTGIAHTRWATHGEPSTANAHPHISTNIAVVHNGIIENHEELRDELIAKGFIFSSQTDTEVIAHLIELELSQNHDLLTAVTKTLAQLKGAYGMVALDKNDPSYLIAARSGSPLIIGCGLGENFLASDQLALLSVTNKFIFLEEGDIAKISRREITIYNHNGDKVDREIHQSALENDAADKGKFRHFMQKEIFEQPTSIANTLDGRVTLDSFIIESIGSGVKDILAKIEHVQIIACGTSYNAGLTASYWMEALAGVSCSVEIASEFRYRKSVTRPNSLLLTISQSGETADTLAAFRLAKQNGYPFSMTICNSSSSSLVRESDLTFITRAGVEIGVASTKAFTTQLTTLLLLVGAIGKLKGNIDRQKEKEIVKALLGLSSKVEQALELDSQIQQLSQDFAEKNHALFLGRGEFYPIAIEGALKLKEISYIHAEAYAAGELKHGPLALIDADMPVIVVAPSNELLEKLKSNIEEVRARGGILYVFTAESTGFKASENMKIINMPEIDEIVAPIFYTVALQLLSYHVAVIKGTDVDQPRNLAKAVTVE